MITQLARLWRFTRPECLFVAITLFAAMIASKSIAADSVVIGLAAESVDTDGDGVGDNEDTDDDGDGVNDVDEVSPKFVNISTRGFVLDGEKVMIAGFVVEGTDDLKVLVQGVGLELGGDDFQVEDHILDTRISVCDVDGNLIASNDDWDADAGEKEANSIANTDAGAFGLLPGSKSSALTLDVEPGVYTVHLSDKDQIGGVGLIEVYEILEDE